MLVWLYWLIKCKYESSNSLRCCWIWRNSINEISPTSNFAFASSYATILEDPEVQAVVVATPVQTHFNLVSAALKAKKHVFVEKPLCLLESELQEIIEKQAETNKAVMVGFNRRFSPLTAKLKKAVGNNPMTMLYRINAGAIPRDNWIQDLEIGGGRVLGEVCHFIDYLTYLNENHMQINILLIVSKENH